MRFNPPLGPAGRRRILGQIYADRYFVERQMEKLLHGNSHGGPAESRVAPSF